MSVGVCFNLPAGYAMDRQYQSTGGGHLYNSQESSSGSTLWDLDSSSLITPEYLPPSVDGYVNRHQQQGDTMRREISEESGYQTAVDEGSSSWDWSAEDYHHQVWSSDEFPPQQYNQINDAVCWLQQQQPTSWGIPDDTPIQSTSSYEETSYTVTGRSESTSSDDSNQVSVPSGNQTFATTKYQITGSGKGEAIARI